MARSSTRNPRVVQRVNVASPQGSLPSAGENRATRRRQRRLDRESRMDGANALAGLAGPDAEEQASDGLTPALRVLMSFLEAKGDISHLLSTADLTRLGVETVREFELDAGSNCSWCDQAEESLRIAAQEDEAVDGGADFPFEDAANINYPMLTVAAQQWCARAGPELIRGDQVVGVKTFEQPGMRPTPQELQQNTPPPPDPQAAAQSQSEAGAEVQTENLAAMQALAMKARAERVRRYLNFVIFYEMEGWEDETDQLLNDIPIIGAGFKKVWMGTTGLRSEYVSALKLVVDKDTKSIWRCPRITQVYDIHPNEILQRQRSGRFRDDVDLPVYNSDPEAAREFLEQHRLEDLDGDGFKEPYIVTVDRRTRQLLRIEPAFGVSDVMVGPDGRVLNIDRFLPFPAFTFLKDPRGGFYGIGFGKLLQSIMAAVDSGINQLLDAGTAANAGGGFIGSNVRLQAGGQGGSMFFRPGEYQVVNVDGRDIQAAIWERTLPQASAVTMQMVELLLAAAKDIASVKDVVTGDAANTAPVGTTMALQNQALQVFSSIYRRVYRGFAAEFRTMFKCLQRYGGDRERTRYKELTGGDFDSDFSGDGTDIVPVADPAVVTKIQKVQRVQSTLQLAESPVGQAAGMQTPQAAKEIVREALEAMEWDRPDRFTGDVQPNPEAVAKVQDMAASTALKLSQAARSKADTTFLGAKTLREFALAAGETHGIRQEAHRVMAEGLAPPPPQPSEGDPNGPPASAPPPGVGPAPPPA